MHKVRLFSGFERFWHLIQMLLIFGLLVTGFTVHGTWSPMSFELAVDLHTLFALTLIALWVFAIFWHFTTGEWKQYIPTLTKVDAMFKFYLFGIFTDAPHPFKATTLRKHNPLQRLAYLFVMLDSKSSPGLVPTAWQFLATIVLYPFAQRLIDRFEDADVRFR